MAKKSTGKPKDPSKAQDHVREFASATNKGLDGAATPLVGAALKGGVLWAGAFTAAEAAQSHDMPNVATGAQVVSDSAGFVALTSFLAAVPLAGADAAIHLARDVLPKGAVHTPRPAARSLGKAFTALSAIAAVATSLSYTVPRAGFTLDTPGAGNPIGPAETTTSGTSDRINLANLQQASIAPESSKADTSANVVRALKNLSAPKRE